LDKYSQTTTQGKEFRFMSTQKRNSTTDKRKQSNRQIDDIGYFSVRHFSASKAASIFPTAIPKQFIGNPANCHHLNMSNASALT
jgi:hypothetical protein